MAFQSFKSKANRVLPCRFSFMNLLLATAICLSKDKIFSDAERLFPGNPYSHREMLDPNGRFLLEWIADPKKSVVVFNITAETRGYVAIGFSKTGRMAKSDVVLAGVDRGIPYISDRFTRHDKRIPVEDIQQNWKLLAVWENRTHTSVRMSRKKDTCDPQDYVISDNTMHLLWAFGEDDILDYHFKNRGSVQIHIMQPDLVPKIPSAPRLANSTSLNPQGYDVWRLSVTVNAVPSGGSWCVFQKGPELLKINNIIGFSTPMTEEKVKKYVDRLVIYKCLPNYGRNAQKHNHSTEDMQTEIEKLDEYSGECKNATELFTFCRDIIYTWGMGGKDIFLPKNAGIPFGGTEDYYLLQSYLITPQTDGNSTDSFSTTEESESVKTKRENEFDIDTDILLTESPRKYEAKILKIGYDSMTPVLVPPVSKDFEIFGHCPNECTTKIISKRKPLRPFGVSFDTGPLGKSVTLHHLRNAFELPILFHDGNFDPAFQQMQFFPLDTPIRPGDQITVRCKYKSAITRHSSLNNNTIPIHRCLAYLWYYNDQTNSSIRRDSYQIYECTSKIHPGDFARWIDESAPIEIRRNISSPHLLDKLKKLKWTPHLQLSLYELYELGRYRSTCGGVIQQHQRVTNGTNKIGSKVNRRNGKNNGTSGAVGLSALSGVGEITVYPLPVEDIPNTIGCPTLDGPLLLGPHGPVIFGYP